MEIKKHIAFIMFFTIHLPAYPYAQTANYSATDLAWSKYFLQKTISEFSYNNRPEGIKNSYDITFGDSTLIICNDKGLKTNLYFITRIYSKDIDSILITPKKYNIWLAIKLMEGKKKFPPLIQSITGVRHL